MIQRLCPLKLDFISCRNATVLHAVGASEKSSPRCLPFCPPRRWLPCPWYAEDRWTENRPLRCAFQEVADRPSGDTVSRSPLDLLLRKDHRLRDSSSKTGGALLRFVRRDRKDPANAEIRTHRRCSLTDPEVLFFLGYYPYFLFFPEGIRTDNVRSCGPRPQAQVADRLYKAGSEKREIVLEASDGLWGR